MQSPDEPGLLSDRLLVHIRASERLVVEVEDVYVLEAEGKATVIRLRSAETLLDRRGLGELKEYFERYGFLRIHRNHMVNLRRVREIRRREGRQDWEVKLDPPVNRVLPVARGREEALFAAFGEG
jgi:DNA-binding LytR/AlgR family response regulator